MLVAVLSLSGCADRTDRTDRDVDPTGTSTGVDEQTLASIEQSVSEAEAILSGLDQEFHQDDDE